MTIKAESVAGAILSPSSRPASLLTHTKKQRRVGRYRYARRGLCLVPSGDEEFARSLQCFIVMYIRYGPEYLRVGPSMVK